MGKRATTHRIIFCKAYGKQFISDFERTCRGPLSSIACMIKIMPVRGIGIRDISVILKVSVWKVLKTLKSTSYRIKPAKTHYDCLEIDEFWTKVGRKTNKIWLIYAYHRETGEIVVYVWGKRDLKTAKKLRKRLKRLGVTYDRIACDGWDRFLRAFKEDEKLVGKKHTVGIEGNNCRLRHRIRRAFRKTCCFRRNCSTIGKSFQWLSFTSSMVSFDLHHTF